MDRSEKNFVPVPTTKEALVRQLARLCPEHRIDLAGAVALPCPLPHRDHWFDWLTGAATATWNT